MGGQVERTHETPCELGPGDGPVRAEPVVLRGCTPSPSRRRRRMSEKTPDASTNLCCPPARSGPHQQRSHRPADRLRWTEPVVPVDCTPAIPLSSAPNALAWTFATDVDESRGRHRIELLPRTRIGVSSPGHRSIRAKESFAGGCIPRPIRPRRRLWPARGCCQLSSKSGLPELPPGGPYRYQRSDQCGSCEQRRTGELCGAISEKSSDLPVVVESNSLASGTSPVSGNSQQRGRPLVALSASGLSSPSIRSLGHRPPALLPVHSLPGKRRLGVMSPTERVLVPAPIFPAAPGGSAFDSDGGTLLVTGRRTADRQTGTTASAS